jgi:hypothetical protein
MTNVIDSYLALEKETRDFIWESIVKLSLMSATNPVAKHLVGDITVTEETESSISESLHKVWSGVVSGESGSYDPNTIGLNSPLVTKNENPSSDEVRIVYELHPEVVDYIIWVSTVNGVQRFSNLRGDSSIKDRIDSIASNTLRNLILDSLSNGGSEIKLREELAGEATLLCAGRYPVLTAVTPLVIGEERKFVPSLLSKSL